MSYLKCILCCICPISLPLHSPPWPLNIYLMAGDVLSLTLLQRFPIAIDVIKSISVEFTKTVSLAKWQIKLQLKNKFNPCIGIPPTH